MAGEAKKAADAENGLRWIRFERYLRYHAVYTKHRKLYWTYCGMSVAFTGVRDQKNEAPARCACCRSRLKRPYLIPEELARLKKE
jgi:hypothetical protein